MTRTLIIFAAIVLPAAFTLGGCLSDDTLRMECDTDSDCPGGSCIYHVCVGDEDTADVLPDCGPGLTPCGSTCADLRRSPDHCGACNEPCLAGAQETAECLAGVCTRECVDGWFDLDGEALAGCDYECTPSSGVTDEVCDGVDNDCNGLTDDEDPDTNSPVCADQDGVCRGTRQPCVDGNPRACTEADYRDQVGDQLESGEELLCDGEDNNCDGRVDEHCCGGADDRFEAAADAGDWTVGGFQWRGENLQLVAHDGASVVTFDVDRFRGVSRSAEWALPSCHFDELHYSPGLQAMYGLCNGAAFGLRDSEGRNSELGRVPDGTTEYRLQADGEEGTELLAVSFVDSEGATSTVLALDDGDSPLVVPFDPPTAHAGTSVAWTDSTGVASFVVPGAEVRLQELDDALEPVGFGIEVATPDWQATSTFETDLVGASRGRVHIFYPAPTGGVANAIWTLGEEEVVTGPTLGEDPILRVDASRSRAGVLLSAVTDSALHSWLLSDDGESIAEWRLPMEDVLRAGALGEVPMRVATATDGAQLWIAFGSPRDAAGPDDGLVLIRLGRNGLPLCQ